MGARGLFETEDITDADADAGSREVSSGPRGEKLSPDVSTLDLCSLWTEVLESLDQIECPVAGDGYEDNAVLRAVLLDSVVLRETNMLDGARRGHDDDTDRGRGIGQGPLSPIRDGLLSPEAALSAAGLCLREFQSNGDAAATAGRRKSGSARTASDTSDNDRFSNLDSLAQQLIGLGITMAAGQ